MTLTTVRKNAQTVEATRGLGSAPASGAANDALVVGIRAGDWIKRNRVRREGAPNSSRGRLRSLNVLKNSALRISSHALPRRLCASLFRP